MKEVKYKTFEELKEELGDRYDKLMYDMNLELLKQKYKAIEYINKWLEGKNNEDIIIVMNNLGNILQGKDKGEE